LLINPTVIRFAIIKVEPRILYHPLRHSRGGYLDPPLKVIGQKLHIYHNLFTFYNVTFF